jgi:hypothetical protein
VDDAAVTFLVLGVADRVAVSAGADDGDAEQVRRDRGEGRIHARHLAVGVIAQARVRLVDPGLHDLGIREVAGRDVVGHCSPNVSQAAGLPSRNPVVNHC